MTILDIINNSDWRKMIKKTDWGRFIKSERMKESAMQRLILDI